MTFTGENKVLKYALYSNALYVFLFFLFRPNGINLGKILITSFLAFSAVTVIYLGFKYRKGLKDIPKSSRLLFSLLILWGIIVIVRSFSLSIQDWVTNFGNVYMGLAWVVPVTLILGLKIENWKTVFSAIWFMFSLMIISLLFLPYHAALPGKLYTEWTWLLRAINFVIIFGIARFALSKRLLIYITFVIYVFVALETEQRIEFVFLTIIAFFYLLSKIKHVKIKKPILKYIIAGFILLIVLVFTYGYTNISSGIAKAIEFKDSRTFLFEELLVDLSSSEKLFGRGSLGTYYSPLFAKQATFFERIGYYWYGIDSPIRITVEVGYLQMILKGGFTMLILVLGLKLQAVYLALFKSNNEYIKRMGLFILVLTILSLISFRPAFTPTFILLWISIGTVLSRKNRQMTNDEVKDILKLK